MTVTTVCNGHFVHDRLLPLPLQEEAHRDNAGGFLLRMHIECRQINVECHLLMGQAAAITSCTN